jgi:hypothetical protein
MVKRKILCILMILAVSMSAFAINVTGSAPEYRAVDPGNQSHVDLADTLNSELTNAFSSVIGNLNGQLEGFPGFPQEFIRAWGNAGVFASHGATHRANSGYKFMTISIGSTMGYQLPMSPIDLVRTNTDIFSMLVDDGDLALGFNLQLLNAQVGFNMKSLLDKLYLSVRGGYFKVDNLDLLEGFHFSSGVVGILANYQLLPRINLFGVIDWKGINLGTGFIYQGTRLGFSRALDPITQPVDGDVVLQLDPRLNFSLNVNTFTIPLEAMTALRILTLNVPFGLGVDIAFGSSSLTAGLDGNTNVDGIDESILTRDKEGKLGISAGGSVSPTGFNIKLMTGVGFSAGPFFMDIPFTYYFIGNAFSVGLTAGLSF